MSRRRILAIALAGLSATGVLSFAIASDVYDEAQGAINGCVFNGIVEVTDAPGWNGSISRTYPLYGSSCALKLAENWPWTGSQYVGYSTGWQTGDATLYQGVYDTTRAYGYHTVQQPVGTTYQPPVETYVSQ